MIFLCDMEYAGDSLWFGPSVRMEMVWFKDIWAGPNPRETKARIINRIEEMTRNGRLRLVCPFIGFLQYP
jgi:hypothetical protein